MTEPIRFVLDAETAREQEQRHIDKANHYDRLAREERAKAKEFRGYAEHAEAGSPPVFSVKVRR